MTRFDVDGLMSWAFWQFRRFAPGIAALFCVQFIHYNVLVGIDNDGLIGVVNHHARLAAGDFFNLLHRSHIHGDILPAGGLRIVGGQLGSLGEGVVRRCFAAARR